MLLIKHCGRGGYCGRHAQQISSNYKAIYSVKFVPLKYVSLSIEKKVIST